MKRLKSTAVSILLVVTLSVMGIPQTAFAEVGEAVGANASASQDEAAKLASAESDATGSSSLTAVTNKTIKADGNNDIDGYFSVSTEDGRDYEFHYKDSYFASSSYTFDWSLAAMSNCLALSAFGADTGDTDADYANADANVKDLLATLGFKDYACTEEFHKVPTSESIGAAIANKTVVDENGKERTLIAVAVRGGNYEQEWAGNAILGDGTGEAEGFGIARDKVAELIYTYLEQHSSEFTEQPKIWIVGFSRGSAVANLTANFLNYCMESYQNDTACSTDLAKKVSGKLKDLKATQEDLYSYGFEVPAGGTDASVYHCNTEYKNMWNIINPTDIVPLLAPSEWGFKRYGTDVDPTEGIDVSKISSQLRAISDNAFKDWCTQSLQDDREFRLYYGSVVDVVSAFLKDGDITGLNYVSKDASYMSTYLKTFVNFLASDSIGSRASYASKYQDVFSIVAQVMFAGGNISKLVDVAWDGVKDGFDAKAKTKLIAKLVAAVMSGPMALLLNSSQRAILLDTAQDSFDNAMRALQNDDETHSMLGDEAIDTLSDHKNDLIKLALDLASEDNEFGGMLSGIALIPTALYYKGEIMYGHDENYNFALVRAHDPNYENAHNVDFYRFDIASSETGGALENYKVSVKNINGKELAVLENGKFSEIDGDMTVFYERNENGSETLFVDRNKNSHKNVTFELTSTSSSTDHVYLNYYDYTKTNRGLTVTPCDDEWCNKAITLDDTCTIKVIADYDSTDAVMEKWVDAKVEFVEYNEQATGHFESVDTTNLQISVSNALENEVYDVTEGSFATVPVCVASSSSSADGRAHYGDETANFQTLKTDQGTHSYIPTWAFTPVLNSDGTTAIDDSGDYKRAATFESLDTWGNPKWSGSYNLDSLGDLYYVVCNAESSVTYPISRKATLENGTEISDMKINVEAAGGSSLVHVAPGTKVEVSVEPTGSDVFKRWNFFETGITEDEVTYTKADKTAFTFTMPSRPIMLNAICMTKEEATNTLTVTGGWDSDHGTPADHGWKATSERTDHFSATSTKTYAYDSDEAGALNGAAASHLFYLKASEYAKDSSDAVTQQFDHWEVVTDDGTSYDGLMGKAADGSTYIVNGCTEASICIDGADLEQSLTVRSVYRDIQYAYSLTLSDGSTKTGSANAGATKTFSNVVPTGYECTSWETTVTPVAYSTDENGYITATTESPKTQTVDGSDLTLTFTGDVTATANKELLSYKLTIAESGQPAGTSVVKSATTADGDALDLESVPAGTQVKLTLEYPEGYRYTGCSGLTNGSVKFVASKDGTTATLSFEMPGQDTNLALKTAQETYELSYSDCTATDAQGAAVACGSAVVLGTSLMLVADAAPDGQEFDDWKIEAADGTTVRHASYRNALGENVLVVAMPAADVSVTPVYKEAAKTPIESAEVKVLDDSYTDGVLTEGDTLPATLTASGEGITEDASLTWLNEDGSAVTSTTVEKDKLYKAQVTLYAESGYCFDETFAATIDGNQATIANLGDNVVVVTCGYVARAKDYSKPYEMVAYNVFASNYVSFEWDAGDSVELTANEAYAGSTFTGFSVEPKGAVTLNDKGASLAAAESLATSTESPAQTVEFTMPEQNVQLTANYAIDTIELNVAEPVVGEELSFELSFTDGESAAAKLCESSVFYIDENGKTLDASCVAENDSTYFMIAVLEGPNRAGYTFSDDCVATVNGQSADVGVASDGAYVLFKFDTPAAETTYAISTSAQDANGNAVSDVSVNVTTDDGSALDAVKPGTQVSVSFEESEVNTLDHWTFEGIAEADVTYASTDKTAFTFTMPSSEVKLVAVCTSKAEDSPASKTTKKTSSASGTKDSTAASTGDVLGVAAIGLVVIAILAAAALIVARRKKRS